MFANRRFDRARMSRILCIALALASGAPPVYAADRPPPRPKKLDPRDAWMAAGPRLLQADRQSVEAFQKRLLGIKGYLGERKKGAAPFAEAVLSVKGKLLYTAGMAEQAAGAVAGLFGSTSSGPDSFKQYVRDCFREHVLDPRQLQTVIDAALEGYAGDVQAVENQLLVDLRVDLADESLDLQKLLPSSQREELHYACNWAADQAIDAAGKDFVAMIVSGAVSWVASDALGNTLTRPGDSTGRKLGVNAAAGLAVDKAIDVAMNQAGYDPLRTVAEKIAAQLDRINDGLLIGDETPAQWFPTMLLLSVGHPNEAVRAACQEATDAMERSPSLGMLPRILRQQYERSRRRALAVYHHIFGQDAQVPEELIRPPAPVNDLPDDQQILRDAANLKAAYGGAQ
jgi:hypothetical protein